MILAKTSTAVFARLQRRPLARGKSVRAGYNIRHATKLGFHESVSPVALDAI
jgi:hypothetical protein